MIKRKSNFRFTVYSAFLVAISIVLTRFVAVLIPIGGATGIRVSFGEMPIMLSGFMFGPVLGGLTGLAADLIGFLINSQGAAFHPGFTLSSILWGVIPGLAILISKKIQSSFIKLYSFKRILLIVSLTTIIISLILNTFWLTQLIGKGFVILLIPRTINAIVSIPIMSSIISILLKALNSYIDI